MRRKAVGIGRSMSDDSKTGEAKRAIGREMACEGMMRTGFGKGSTEAGTRAMDRIRGRSSVFLAARMKYAVSLAAAALFLICVGAGLMAMLPSKSGNGSGANPETAASSPALKILDWRVSPDSTLVIKWSGASADKSYRIESTTNLLAGFNETVKAGLPGMGQMNCYTVAVDNTASRYFRVVEERRGWASPVGGP